MGNALAFRDSQELSPEFEGGTLLTFQRCCSYFLKYLKILGIFSRLLGPIQPPPLPSLGAHVNTGDTRLSQHFGLALGCLLILDLGGMLTKGVFMVINTDY